MSISRYFLPITKKNTSLNGSTKDGDRCPEKAYRHNEDVAVAIQLDDDDEIEDDCQVIENTADFVAKDSIVLDETVIACEDVVLPSVPISHSLENPFAKWARSTLDTVTNTTKASGGFSQTVLKPHHSSRTTSSLKNLHSDQTISPNKKRKLGKDDVKKSSSKSKTFIPMTQMSEAEQQNEIEKWHALVSLFEPAAGTDDEARVEQRRFHMLLVTLLHARCQEPCVRQAMAQLQLVLGPITVQSMAQCTVEVIQPHITNLQYHNTKAKYIIAAAQYLLEQDPQGRVPCDEAALRKVPGIGPLFADLHAFVNTTSRHLQYLRKQGET